MSILSRTNCVQPVLFSQEQSFAYSFATGSVTDMNAKLLACLSAMNKHDYFREKAPAALLDLHGVVHRVFSCPNNATGRPTAASRGARLMSPDEAHR